MKVIDLLNKIANGEEVPKKINYEGISYTYDDYTTDYKRTIGKDLFTYLFTEYRTETFLNNEVEITEEDKKIEKIPYMFNLKYVDTNDKEVVINGINDAINGIYDKINEIIDYLEENK